MWKCQIWNVIFASFSLYDHFLFSWLSPSFWCLQHMFLQVVYILTNTDDTTHLNLRSWKKKIYWVQMFIMLNTRMQHQSPKLKTKYRYENQFWNPGFKNGVMGSLVDINILIWTVFYLISSYSPFFKISLFKIYTNVKTPKRKLGSFVQRYSFKFRAQGV